MEDLFFYAIAIVIIFVISKMGDFLKGSPIITDMDIDKTDKDKYPDQRKDSETTNKYQASRARAIPVGSRHNAGSSQASIFDREQKHQVSTASTSGPANPGNTESNPIWKKLMDSDLSDLIDVDLSGSGNKKAHAAKPVKKQVPASAPIENERRSIKSGHARRDKDKARRRKNDASRYVTSLRNREPEALRSAFVMSEIFGPPASVKPYDEKPF